MRIVVGPIEISGIAYSLVKGFRELGEEAELVLGYDHPFSYGQEKKSFIFEIWRKIGTARAKCSRSSFLKKSILVVLHRAFGWACFLFLLSRSDVFLFTYGSTFTDSAFELFLARLLKKKIFFVYFGSESRPPFWDGAIATVDADDVSLIHLYRLAKRHRERVRLHERYADLIINSPATGHYHSRAFVNWFSLGVPIGGRDSLVASSVRRSRASIRILHSPSHPLVKGTSLIEAAIGRLVEKGYSIDFVRLTGVPNNLVMSEIAACDFVVDQVFSDTPMAALAAEAASLGKPSIVAGYFSDFAFDYIRDSDFPPSLFVSPDELESAIERLIVDVEYRRQLGVKAKNFMDYRWSVSAVALRYISLFKGEFPEEWLFDPYAINYIFGGGVSKQRLSRILGAYVKKFGISGLFLNDKPRLEIEISKFLAEEKRQVDDA